MHWVKSPWSISRRQQWSRSGCRADCARRRRAELTPRRAACVANRKNKPHTKDTKSQKRRKKQRQHTGFQKQLIVHPAAQHVWDK
jgi:hypothetical protein